MTQANEGGITFDADERWLLHGERAPPGETAFVYSAVLLHELGHVLGFGHSSNPKDIMSPYYVAGPIVKPSRSPSQLTLVPHPPPHPPHRILSLDHRPGPWPSGGRSGHPLGQRHRAHPDAVPARAPLPADHGGE